jgi:hypothetical protein
MLVNNLCCDPVCLSKIFSTNKEGLYKKNYSDKAQALSVVLPFVQTGVLKDSTYKLEAVKNVEYIDVVRYELLYHIINSYEGSYLPKRALVDYDKKTKEPKLADWREVKWEGNYSKVEKVKIDKADFTKILENYPEIYPDIQDLSSYRVTKHVLSEVEEYSIVYKNRTAGKVEIKVIYKDQGKLVRLVEESE